MPSVTLENGNRIDSATSTQDALDEFAKTYDAAKKTQKVDAAPTPEGGEAHADAPAASEPPAAAVEAGADEGEREADGRFKKRAKSQDASAGDVPRIKELTRKWREAEAKGLALEQRLAALEQSAPKPAEPKPDPAAVPDGFMVPKPKLTDYPTYEDFNEALIDWKVQAREFQKERKATETQAQTDGQKFIADAQSKYQASAAKFAEAHEDFDEVVSGDLQVHPLIHAAILLDAEHGPSRAYALAKQQDLVYELNLLAEGKPVNVSTVASMQRVLAARLASAVPAQTTETPSITKAAPPIKPVRGTPTVPEVSITQLTGDDYLRARLPQLRKRR